MSEPKSQDKPFEISKWKVWEAYVRVKANKGAAGIDEQSIAQFEADRDRNLYRIWNRMSSGSYFPPPVKAVEIPKAGGKGVRVLGVPAVEARRVHGHLQPARPAPRPGPAELASLPLRGRPCATSADGGCDVEDRDLWMRCCAGDGGMALRIRSAGRDSKPPSAAAVNEPWW